MKHTISLLSLPALGALIVLGALRPAAGQIAVDLSGFRAGPEASVAAAGDSLAVRWDAGRAGQGRLVLDLRPQEPLLRSLGLQEKGTAYREIAGQLDPVFLLTRGKRTLKPSNGWVIFFDNPYQRPYETVRLALDKQHARVVSEGKRLHVLVSGLSGGHFSGELDITLFVGSPLLNIAAAVSTAEDSTAIMYDAGLEKRSPWDRDRWNNINPWRRLSWIDPAGQAQGLHRLSDPMSATPVAVKYRALAAETAGGTLAVFPAPHQYFAPLDNAYNQRFVWYGRNYRNMVRGFGIGIRQELEGDKRWVPWFNAPPGTVQRLNFFCLLGRGDGPATLAAVARYTHGDHYPALPGYHTFASHYHVEPEEDILLGKPPADVKAFAGTFRRQGVDIVHLASFHGPGHPEGPDSLRLKELKLSHDLCAELSGKGFLMLPGEEPNHFFGGHWISFFPRPVYWVMSRKAGQAFVSRDPRYGQVYHIGDKEDMLRLLEAEDGLAWASHPRVKGSTGYPDAYRAEAFYRSPRFLGAAWKAMPADLSLPYLGQRPLDLLSDMANWGQHKYMLAEGDLFKLLPEYEAYAHMNVNYLQLDSLPAFGQGWPTVLDALRRGRFFVSTGEILLPRFSVNGTTAGGTLSLGPSGEASMELEVRWTFPLQYIAIVSGDGTHTYRDSLQLTGTSEFGSHRFRIPLRLQGRRWVRAEVWDAAANGAFTQCVWLEPADRKSGAAQRGG